MPSRGQNGGAMNDNFAQQVAQTPSPSTGSRQATHNVGSAMSSASRAVCFHTPWAMRNAPRKCEVMERDDEVSASMGEMVMLAPSTLNHKQCILDRPRLPETLYPAYQSAW